MLISNDFDTTKNPKVVPNWKVPGEIINVNDTNDSSTKIKFKNNIKVLNVAKLKHFYENVEKSIDNLIKNLISLMKKCLQTSVTFLIKRKVKDPSPGQE